MPERPAVRLPGAARRSDRRLAIDHVPARRPSRRHRDDRALRPHGRSPQRRRVALNTRFLRDGEHRVTAEVRLAGGGVVTYTAVFQRRQLTGSGPGRRREHVECRRVCHRAVDDRWSPSSRPSPISANARSYGIAIACCARCARVELGPRLVGPSERRRVPAPRSRHSVAGSTGTSPKSRRALTPPVRRPSSAAGPVAGDHVDLDQPHERIGDVVVRSEVARTRRAPPICSAQRRARCRRAMPRSATAR